jgi:uncharacterized zinc-type alcohol dehydrogenase-like protein
MTMNVIGYAASSAKAELSPYNFVRRGPRADDVVVEILYCGICHSDVHHVRDDWNNTTFPVVPGHEIIGRVISVGPDVTRFNQGDTVGNGCMVDSCQNCEACKQGLEQYCIEFPTLTFNSKDRQDGLSTYGGYSEKIVVPEKFVLRIPDGLDLKGVAPLLCAGITTWSPLRHWDVKQGSNIGVIGLGGLGHMALKLVKGLGANVTLFSRSPGKEQDARRLGADNIVISTDPDQMASVNNKFDLIIDTVPYVHDVNPYIMSLSLNGTLVMVGLLGNLEPTLNTAPLVMGRKSVAGSVIGGLQKSRNFLIFVASMALRRMLRSSRFRRSMRHTNAC